MPPKRPANQGDKDKDPKRPDDGESPPPVPRSTISSPSASPASSVSSSSSLTTAFKGASVRDRGPRALSPDTQRYLESQGIYPDPVQHPNFAERGPRAYRPGGQVADAQMPLVPIPPISNEERLRRLRLQRAQRAQRVQAAIDRNNKARIARDSQIDWLVPSGQLLPEADKTFRYWGQNKNEVVLVLPPSPLTDMRHPLECHVTVEELQTAIGNLHCLTAVPPPPRERQSRRPDFGGDIDDHGNGASAYVADSDDDVPVAPPEILRIYLTLLRYCGLGPFSESPDFGLWEFRSTMRRKAGQEMVEEDSFPEVLHVTFHDIEMFIRQPPGTRNLQRFIDENRSDWLTRWREPVLVSPHVWFRSDLRFERDDAGGVLSEMDNSDRDTKHGGDTDDDDSHQIDDSQIDDSQSVGSMSPRGGKRRKPATKRKARRHSASSKRKPTSAAKRRRTATIKSKRTRRTRVRRATRRN